MKIKKVLAVLISAAVLCGLGLLFIGAEGRAYLRWAILYRGPRLTGDVTVTLDGKPCACTVTAGEGSYGIKRTEQGDAVHLIIDTGGKAGGYGRHTFTVQPDDADCPPVTVKISFGNWWDVSEFDLHFDADTSAGTVTASCGCRFLREDGDWETRSDSKTAEYPGEIPVQLSFVNV